jgi:CHAT domain
MSSWATEHVTPLEAALLDRSSWVRIGAAHALAEHAPRRVAKSLEKYWNPTDVSLSELAMMAWACELGGETRLQPLASALGVNAERLSSILDQPQRNEFVEAVVATPQLKPVELIIEQMWLARMRRLHAADAPPAEHVAGRYENAVDMIRQELASGAMYAGSESIKTEGQVFFAAIQEDLLSADIGKREQAVRALGRIVMTETNFAFRHAAASALKSLGFEGGQVLISSLIGAPLATPSAQQLAEFADESVYQRDEEPNFENERLREIGAAYLTYEALQNFTDEETISAIVELALAGPLPGRARAEMILASMPLDRSLPLLFHAGVSCTEWDERERAAAIIDGIVGKREGYAIHYHRVRWVTRIDVSLQWFLDLLRLYQDISPAHAEYASQWQWAFDRGAAAAILGEAFRSIPLLEGEIHVLYSDLPPWDKLVGFAERGFQLMRTRRGTRSLSTIERYPRLEFPRQCVLHKPARLTIQLTAERAEGSRSPLTFETRGKKEIEILAIVHAPSFAMEPGYYQPLPMPVTSSSPVIAFELTPNEVGPHTIEVALFREAERVGYYFITTDVDKAATVTGTGQATVVDTPNNSDLLRRGRTRAVIFADWQEPGPITFRILDPYADATAPRPIGTSGKSISRDNAQAWVQKQSGVIETFVTENFKTEAEMKSVVAQITAVGHSLFEEVGCPELAEALEQFPDESIIAIESNESWIPWELLASSPTGPMLGERFQIIRTPRIRPGDRSAMQVTSVADPNDSVHQILAVVGDGIARGKSPGDYDAKGTFGATKPTLQELIETTSSELGEKISAADIVHFTCHGKNDPLYHLSLGSGPAKRLLVDQVKQLSLKPGALVFVNACSSDRAQLLLTSFETLGWNFYLQGARPFIGTLGPVPVKHAIAMAKSFYHWLLVEGLPVGSALRRARRSTMSELRSPFSMFYCMYGPASVSRKLGAARQR